MLPLGSAEGFEDDPITYVKIGWSGGPLPPELGAELGKQLAGLLDELQWERLQAQEARRMQEDLEHKARSRAAVQGWMRRKEDDARRASSAAAARGASRPRASPRSREAHWEAWCRRHDAARFQARVARGEGG